MGLSKNGIAFVVAASLATGGVLYRWDQVFKEPQGRGLVDRALMYFSPTGIPKAMKDESVVTKAVYNSFMFAGGDRYKNNLKYYLEDYLNFSEVETVLSQGLTVENSFILARTFVENPKGNGKLTEDERRGFMLFVLSSSVSFDTLQVGANQLPHPNMGLDKLALRTYNDTRRHYISVMANNLLDPKP